MEDVKTAHRVMKGDIHPIHPLTGGYPVIGKTQLDVLLKQITCAVWGGVYQPGWHVTLQQLVCSHLCWHWSRAAAMNSGSTQSIKFHLKLPDVSSSEKHFKCLIMSQYYYFMWVYVVTFHRTAVVPKLVVLRAPFTIEILELYIDGIFQQMSSFQPGLIFAVDRRGHGQDTVIHTSHDCWGQRKEILFQEEGVRSGGGRHPVLSVGIWHFSAQIISFLILSVTCIVAI